MQDHEVISALCEKCGGLTQAAAILSTPDLYISPQVIYSWRERGRVSPHRRLHFLTVFNRVMPKRQHLALEWLADAAALSL